MEKAHEIAAHVMQTAQEGVQINPKELDQRRKENGSKCSPSRSYSRRNSPWRWTYQIWLSTY